ncbi:MAG: phosphatidylserine decarboxylase [Burkholderiales bacterium]|jgi:phosphatidylserine decarboxylase|nr:phosphatidylserine decarboxylase [Burkholderiales bacterium]
MSTYPDDPFIAKPGRMAVAASVALALAVGFVAGWVWSLPAGILALLVVPLSRAPVRRVPRGARAVVCPADGRIVAVERARDPYLDRNATRVSVFPNALRLHANRSPVDGEVKQVWPVPGAVFGRLRARQAESALWMRTAAGADVTAVHAEGLVAPRAFGGVKAGDRLARGQRCGSSRFASRVDLYLPLGAAVKVELGQKVYASETVVAVL